MLYLKEHPTSSPCYGPHGRARCDGFQLDPTDNCNVQYYLYCEKLFKGSTSESWCPSPQGYPQHCCYERALKDIAAGRRNERDPAQYVMSVFPHQRVYQDG